MADVPTIKDWAEAEAYLEGLKATVEADVSPLLQTPGFAPFAICREALSYADHLGHLYTGYRGVRIRFVGYLREVMGTIDENYRLRAEEVYRMYRCGTVHSFMPQTLENDRKQLLYWLCYVGPRASTFTINGLPATIQHLRPVSPRANNEYWLPLSTPCLIDDVVESINRFSGAGPGGERIGNWNRAVDLFRRQRSYNFRV